MIRYRPNVFPISLSVRNEQCFDSVDDLLLHLFERWNRVLSYMGASIPLRPDEIMISDVQGDDPASGYKNVRSVFVTRMTDKCYKTPQCIGFCGE